MATRRGLTGDLGGAGIVQLKWLRVLSSFTPFWVIINAVFQLYQNSHQNSLLFLTRKTLSKTTCVHAVIGPVSHLACVHVQYGTQV
jgi:hypothetical protein